MGLLAAPFYIISGGFLDKGGVSKTISSFGKCPLVRWLPGGLAVVTFLSCAFSVLSLDLQLQLLWL